MDTRTSDLSQNPGEFWVSRFVGSENFCILSLNHENDRSQFTLLSQLTQQPKVLPTANRRCVREQSDSVRNKGHRFRLNPPNLRRRVDKLKVKPVIAERDFRLCAHNFSELANESRFNPFKQQLGWQPSIHADQSIPVFSQNSIKLGSPIWVRSVGKPELVARFQDLMQPTRIGQVSLHDLTVAQLNRNGEPVEPLDKFARH